MKGLFIILFVLCATVFCDAQAQKKDDVHLQLLFHNMVGETVFSKDSVYKNSSGEWYTIRSFKYYVSDIELQYDNNQYHPVPVKPRLINIPGSRYDSLLITVPKGKITGLKFLLGVDSATSVSGVQTGDLDPTKGMFWIWNTGYIMAKLEGASPSSKAPAKQFSYDIGGYKNGENAAREIVLPLPTTAKSQPSIFIITADISRWFAGKNTISIAQQPMCHSPGVLAMQIADNYARMFTLQVR